MTSVINDFFHTVETRQHAWPHARADLHWHLLFSEQDIREKLVEPYREITHRPGLTPVPPRWVHCTVLHGGPVDQYHPSEITQIIERVTNECQTIRSFDLTFDRPSAGTVAVECAARPGAPARQLWELTARADADITGSRFPLIPTVYAPHVSLAYGTAGPTRADRRELKAALSDQPGESIVLRANRLCLVAQSHNRRHITWTPIAQVDLQ